MFFCDLDGKEQFDSKPKLGSLWTIYEIWLDFGPLYGLQSHLYNDGDPLSGDDQSFVLDNVFNYHPDKAAKMGCGIDHLTVNRHGSFQDSRCFFVVSTDS
ncbi:PREDICTED: DCL, partial [Prunus dulcis]